MESQPKVANTIREYYEMYVNPLWPNPLPKLTGVEAERAAKRLYRHVFKKAWTGPIKVTSGRNYSYIRGGVLRVNPDKGWAELVHNLSHSFAYRLDRTTKPHSYPHARLERDMVQYVIDQGWLDGKLKPAEKVQPSAQEVRYQRTLESIKRWDAKLRRAENALKKLAAKKKYYERTLGV
jgi:hypothetical protein